MNPADFHSFHSFWGRFLVIIPAIARHGQPTRNFPNWQANKACHGVTISDRDRDRAMTGDERRVILVSSRRASDQDQFLNVRIPSPVPV